MKYLLSFTLYIAMFVPLTAQANDTFSFRKPSNYKELQAVAQSNFEGKMALIAAVDLNDDFIDEFIIKPLNCTKGVFCRHVIVAYMDRAPIIIGEFDAHQITILEKKDYGIKRLTVYNRKNNDFSSNSAFWDPTNFKYQLIK